MRAPRPRPPRITRPVAATPPGAPPGPGPNTTPTDLVAAGGRLPSTRRLLLGGGLSTAVVLFGNLGGATSGLLSATDAGVEAARKARLDVIFPVRGATRAISYADGWEFEKPAAWLQDATVARRVAAAGEASRPLDPLAAPRRATRAVAEPGAAYGPPGSTGETNASVIVAPIEPGFSLRSLGDAGGAASTFLSQTFPPDSGRTATLIAADERTDGAGTLYYVWRYRVAGAAFDRVNACAVAARPASPGRRPELLTLNAQAPVGNALAETREGRALLAGLERCAASFRVFRPRPPGA